MTRHERFSGILIVMARRNLSYLRNQLLFLCGLPCGVFTGLTGIGTSVLLMPLLGFLLGMRGSRASGVTLAVTFFAALTGLLSYGLHHEVVVGLAVLLAVGQFVGAVLGQRIALRWPVLARPNIGWTLLIILIGLGMLANSLGWPHTGLPAVGVLVHPSMAAKWLFWAEALATALVVGLVSRIIAFGAILLVPAEAYLLHLPIQMAAGTALLVLLLASLPGMLIHARQGDVDPRAGTWISAGAVFGTLIGAYYGAEKVPAAMMLLVYGVAMISVGLGMLWRRETVEDVK
jgi:uncharacterized membrane protein YfcA